MPQAPQPGWWQRNWKWFVPVAVVTGVGLVVAFVFLMVSLVFGMMKSSEPFKEAMARARANPQVQEELGAPINDGLIVSGSITTSNSTGNATLDIPISGPKGEANIHVKADRSGGAWTYSAMDVAIPGKSERIELQP